MYLLPYPRSITVQTGAIDVQEWRKSSSSTETSYTDSSATRQTSVTSYDNISLTSSSSFEEHHRSHNSTGVPLYKKLMKHRAANSGGTIDNNIPDNFSYDTISITSTSSIEETRAAIARVIRSKLQQQQLEKQQMAATGAGKSGSPQNDSTSMSSGSSLEREKRPPHHKKHHHTASSNIAGSGATRIAVRIPRHLLPPGVPLEKLIPERLCSSSSLSGEEVKLSNEGFDVVTSSKGSSSTTTTNGISGKFVVIKDENYNDTDGSGSDTKKYYSDPGPLEAVEKDVSGANLVYYAQHDVSLQEALVNGMLETVSENEDPNSSEISEKPVPQLLVEGKPMPESTNLKTAKNNGKPNVVTVSILEQFGPTNQDSQKGQAKARDATSVSEGSHDNDRGSVSDSSAVSESDMRKKLIKQRSYAEVVATSQLRPLGESRSFGNTRSPNSSISIEETNISLSRSFDDRESSLVARRSEMMDLCVIPPASPSKSGHIDQEHGAVKAGNVNKTDNFETRQKDRKSNMLQRQSSVDREVHGDEVFVFPSISSPMDKPSELVDTNTGLIDDELRKMTALYPTTTETETWPKVTTSGNLFSTERSEIVIPGDKKVEIKHNGGK